MCLRSHALIAVSFCLAFPVWVDADGVADNDPETVRRVPKLGVEVSAADRQELEQGLASLQAAIQQLREKNDLRTNELLPDVEIFERAVASALKYQEFFAEPEIAQGKELLAEGQGRAEALSRGAAPWTEQTGFVVRGYVSRIDHSVQPYGLVVPASYATSRDRDWRCDVWFHGRGETLSEVNFLSQRMQQVGPISPPDTIVLHPYGRYCNAFKFAGEVDVLEALAATERNYRIDPDRIAVRGFSMGGAACWQFAVHYADRWFAANPGAGFSETPEFLKFFQKETLNPTWYERKLWHLYDCTDNSLNLWHCPTVAYSGELDIQKQAAHIMGQALAREGIDLLHIIGPQTAHSIHPESLREIEQRLSSLAERGRQRAPRSVHLVTYTLSYNRMHWVTINALEEHWERAQVDATIQGPARVRLNTVNVADLTLEMPAGTSTLEPTRPVRIMLADQTLEGPKPKSDRSWRCRLYRAGGTWHVGEPPVTGLAKRHGLQGPIDDALMDSFIFVRPTGVAAHPRVGSWAASELDRAIVQWRQQFRGDARVKDDTSITDEDIAASHLVLWGDPASNSLLKRIAPELPIRWSDQEIAVGERSFSADQHALILVYPNPLNPSRYVVLNSSFTYREYDYLNNARQVPKLPDWAVIDLDTPPNSRWPGRVAEADFFGERWELRAPRHD